MKKTGFVLLSILLCVSLIAQEETSKHLAESHCACDDYDSRDASVLSMMGWGIGIALGIMGLFAILDNKPASNTN